MGEILSTLASIGSTVGQVASTVGPIASAVGGIRSLFGGGRKRDSSSLKTARQLLQRQETLKAPIRAQGQELINRAVRGELTPAQKSQVDLQKERALADWRQHLAKLGIPESSAALEGIRRIEQEATALTTQLLQQTFNEGAQLLNLNADEAQALFAGALRTRGQDIERNQAFGGAFGQLLAAMKGLQPRDRESVYEEVARRAGGITYPVQ